jgi:hypothetical protein
MFEDRGERWREMPEPGFVDPPVRESIPDLDSIPPGHAKSIADLALPLLRKHAEG